MHAFLCLAWEREVQDKSGRLLFQVFVIFNHCIRSFRVRPTHLVRPQCSDGVERGCVGRTLRTLRSLTTIRESPVINPKILAAM